MHHCVCCEFDDGTFCECYGEEILHFFKLLLPGWLDSVLREEASPEGGIEGLDCLKLALTCDPFMRLATHGEALIDRVFSVQDL